MKAITTKYAGPTSTRGARITASDMDGNRITIPYPHELSGEAVHRAAAVRLCAKMQWPGAETLSGGAIRNGYVFTFATLTDTETLAALTRAELHLTQLLVALGDKALPDQARGIVTTERDAMRKAIARAKAR